MTETEIAELRALAEAETQKWYDGGVTNSVYAHAVAPLIGKLLDALESALRERDEAVGKLRWLRRDTPLNVLAAQEKT